MQPFCLIFHLLQYNCENQHRFEQYIIINPIELTNTTHKCFFQAPVYTASHRYYYIRINAISRTRHPRQSVLAKIQYLYTISKYFVLTRQAKIRQSSEQMCLVTVSWPNTGHVRRQLIPYETLWFSRSHDQDLVSQPSGND